MAIRFMFEYGNQVVQLPVNPEKLEIATSSDNKTAKVVKLGSINMIRGVGLSTLTIDCFFPINSNPPYVLTKGAFKPPQFYLDFFNRIREDMKPVRLIVTDTEVNMLMSVDSFEVKRFAGDEDLHYSIKLKEFVNYSARKVTITKPTNKPKPQATSSTTSRPKSNFAVGDMVYVTGKWWYDSTGRAPYGNAPSGFVGKIGILVKGRSHPYHIETLDGSWRGWVAHSQLRHK